MPLLNSFIICIYLLMPKFNDNSFLTSDWITQFNMKYIEVKAELNLLKKRNIPKMITSIRRYFLYIISVGFPARGHNFIPSPDVPAF